MCSCKTSVCLAVLTVLVTTASASSSGGGGPYTYDISTQSGLTKLYNSPVFLAEKMTRPLDGTSLKFGWISHSGVRVTLGDKTKWLIHKGDDYGKSSQTVVVNARHMANNWKIVETKDFGGHKKVTDFVKASGAGYHWAFDNCHFGSFRMMNQ